MSRNTPILTWTSISEDENKTPSGPRTRHKHAMCLHRGAIYLFGGKDGNMALKDLWKYDIALGTWEKMRDAGDKPSSLQGHTMLGYKDDLYVFGGDFCFAGSEETPLWIHNIQTNQWKKYKTNSEVTTPSSRRGHSMVHYAGSLYIYGGYIDLKGSTSQLWIFDIGNNMWHLLYNSTTSGDGPGIRHNHTCVVYDKAMWMYGGMADLQVKPDMWRWHFGVRQWQKVKLKSSCPELSDHTAVQVNGHMLVYGGIKEGAPNSDVWSFRFETLTWQKVQPFSCNIIPPPRSQHGSILINPLQLGFSTAASSGNSRTHSMPHVRSGQQQEEDYFSELDHGKNRPQSSPAYVKDDNGKRVMLLNSNKILPAGLPSSKSKNNLDYTSEKDNSGRNLWHKDKSNKVGSGDIDFLEGNCDKVSVDNGYNQGFKSKETTFITYADCSQFNKAASIIKQKGCYSNSATAVAATGVDTPNLEQQHLSFAQIFKQKPQFYRRQSSSCDSVTQGFTPVDSKPLLQNHRSKTVGNVSLDSQSGMDNPGYLMSSGHSSDLFCLSSLNRLSSLNSQNSEGSDFFNHSDKEICHKDNLGGEEKGDIPLKKLRKYDSQFSDDFTPMKTRPSRAMNSRLNKAKHRQTYENRCTSVESLLHHNSKLSLSRQSSQPDMVTNPPSISNGSISKSLDKLATSANGDYNVNLSQTARQKSFNSNDLKLVDIEDDWEFDWDCSSDEQSGTLVHNSPVFRNHTEKCEKRLDDEQSWLSYGSLSVNSRSMLLANDGCSKRFSDIVSYEKNISVESNGVDNVNFNEFSSSHSNNTGQVKPAWHIEDQDIEMGELNVGKREDEVLARSDYYTYKQSNGHLNVESDPVKMISQHKMHKGTSSLYKGSKQPCPNKGKEVLNGMHFCDNSTGNTQIQNSNPSPQSNSVSSNTKHSPQSSVSSNTSFKVDDKNEKFARSYVDEMFMPMAQPTHFVMMVLGGKEARSKDFAVKPIPFWKLEIKFAN